LKPYNIDSGKMHEHSGGHGSLFGGEGSLFSSYFMDF